MLLLHGARRIRPWSVALAVACLFWLTAVAAAAEQGVDIHPEAAGFFVTPEKDATLCWRIRRGQVPQPLEYSVCDYTGRKVDAGRAAIEAGRVEVTLKLSRGYFDCEFPAIGRRFGVVSLPRFDGTPDPFFSIDAAMSWLVRDDDLREALVQGLAHSGIAMSRERLSWGDVHRQPDVWNWEGSRRFETLRRTYKKHGVEVLEMFHHTTPWAGRVGKYPEDLLATARSWQQIARRWKDTWGALEIWNEPDIFFGANLPGDQYVPVVEAIGYALHEAGIDVPIVGGVFAHYNRRFLDTAARCGLLECADVASFHTYGRAPQMQQLVGSYRSWLKDHGHASMPLWITECGRPWKRGPDRPPVDQDALSALDITMKAVEARACGIARYFAFVYPFFEERESNFGMMGRRGTPLRSMAAYAQLARSLARKRYVGDLKCDDPAVQRARVFADEKETLAVIYTGQVAPDAAVRLAVPAERLEGIDGRTLEPADDGAVPIPDGLTYAWLDPGQLAEHLVPDTEAMRLWRAGHEPVRKRPPPSPIVLRFQYDGRLLQPISEGYRVKGDLPEKMPLVVRAFNLSGREEKLTLKLDLSPAKAGTEPAMTRTVQVPARGSAEVSWPLDLRKALAAKQPAEVVIAGTAESGIGVHPLVLVFLPQPE